MKKICSFLLTVLLAFGVLPIEVFASDNYVAGINENPFGEFSLTAQSDLNEITVTLNGKKIDFDQNPIIVDGRTLVPLRAIFEELGATIDWNGNTQTVTSTKDGTTISMTIGKTEMYKNGETKILDVAPQIVGGRTLVPVRAIAEAFNCDVQWDSVDLNVFIATNGISPKLSRNEEEQSYEINYIEVPDWYVIGQVAVKGNQVCFSRDDALRMKNNVTPTFVRVFTSDNSGKLIDEREYIIFESEELAKHYCEELNNYEVGINSFGMTPSEATYYYCENILLEIVDKICYQKDYETIQDVIDMYVGYGWHVNYL